MPIEYNNKINLHSEQIFYRQDGTDKEILPDKAGNGSNSEDSDNVESALSTSLPSSSIENIFEELVGECGIANQDHDDKQNLPIVIVDTHGHAQLDRGRNEAYSLQALSDQRGCENEGDMKKKLKGIKNFHVKSLACFVYGKYSRLHIFSNN